MMLRTVLLTAMMVVMVTGAAAAQESVETAVGFTEIYEQVSPSVVSISVTASATNAEGQESESFSSGSGFVIDEQGHIVTNFHVVENATEIEIRFLDGTLTRAQIIGLDSDSDLAVLKVDLPEANLQPVTFADSAALSVGQPVVAIGSPFGQNWTLTSGIISALNRTIPGLNDFSIGGVIQTDAAINPGNSGGPLLDLEGHVVGVNAQIQTGTGVNSGIGFAIPSNLTQRVAEALIQDGYIEYSYLGISGGDVSLDIIEAFDLPNNLQGVIVSTTTPGGPAARAGLQEAEFNSVNGSNIPRAADIITAVDGTPISGIGTLISYLAQQTEPGQTVTLTVLRGGDEIEIEVRLAPRP
jgi:2-alkenal reductase